MRFLSAPAAVVGFVAVALLPTVASKPLSVLVEELSELHNETQIEKRQCGNPCGFYNQLCCTDSQRCDENANGEAICAEAAGGSWTYGTVLYTSTDLVTRTSIWSSYIAGPTAASGGCSACGAGFYCGRDQNDAEACLPIAGPTPGVSPGATATGSPTATVPFSPPIPTGANGTLVESNAGGGGLSGGAIAGIVIGVILGVILLLLLCFYCCAKSLFSSIMAIFGLGRKRRTREETTYIEEHHHSGSAAAGGGRRWYGQGGSSRPSRPPPRKSGGGMGNLLGVGAGLAGLAAILGMKRKKDRRHDDKSTTTSGYSYYSSDYTSSSSASSDDRRTRHTRHSSRR